eukprot:IDg5841t1
MAVDPPITEEVPLRLSVSHDSPNHSTNLSSNQVQGVNESTNAGPGLHPHDKSGLNRATSHSIEWQFFSDIGRHIIACPKIPGAAKKEYRSSSTIFQDKKTFNFSQSTSQRSTSRHFNPVMTKKQLLELENQAVRFALSANLSFHALENAKLHRLLSLCNPSALLLGRTKLSTTVLNRLSADERGNVCSSIKTVSFISITIDSWTTPTGEKWLGFCRLLRTVSGGGVTLDVSRFEDVTSIGVTKETVTVELQKELTSLYGLATLAGTLTMDSLSACSPQEKVLEAWKSAVESDPGILRNSRAVQIMNTIGSSTFWLKLGLISELLEPLTIEIGLLERRGSNISDVIQSFGRFYALLMYKKSNEGLRFGVMPDIIDDLIIRCCKKQLDAITGPRSGVMKLKEEFCKGIQLDTGISQSSTEVFDGFQWWISCLEFSPQSCLRSVATMLLSIPSGAAELERVWSATLLTMSPRGRSDSGKPFGLVNEFLEDEVSIVIPELSDAEMNAILSGQSSEPPPKKKRRFPGFKKVTRKIKDLFDLSVYSKRAEAVYKIVLD